MKVAVTSSGQNLEAPVDARFGRAPSFLIVDTETMNFEVIPNQQNLQAAQGAGVQAAAAVARLKPDAVLTGHCGPKAFSTLRAAGIPVFVNVTGTVRQAVENYKAGKLQSTKAPDTGGHWV